VGGHSPAAARRAGKLGDGFFPARGAPRDLFDMARNAAREAGRDPDKLEITVSLPDKLDDIPALAAMGVKRVLVPVTPMAGLSAVVNTPQDALAWRDTIARYRDKD
jgi:alkanesulfonate monooxygenase SsuD/methylene tetrahydromethanopterin reductase-like flavin-dependent oxidoreductase (luciferase family)